MAGDTSGTTREIDQTPTWAVAGVCAIIIIISIALEKILHKLGQVYIAYSFIYTYFTSFAFIFELILFPRFFFNFFLLMFEIPFLISRASLVIVI